MNILVLGLFLQIISPGIENSVARQASDYILEIKKGNDLSENYWALSELYSSTCSVNNTVIRLIMSTASSNVKQYFSEFNCTDGLENKYQNHAKRLKHIAKENKLFGLAIYTEIINPVGIFSENSTYFDTDWINELTKEEQSFLSILQHQSSIPLDVIPASAVDLILNAFLYNNRSNYYLNNNSSALADLLKDTSSYEQVDWNPKQSLRFSNLAYLFFDSNRYTELTSYHLNLTDDLFLPQSLEKIRYLKALAFSYFSLGRYDLALTIHRGHISPIATYIENKKELDESNFTQGVNLYSLGKYQKAKIIFEQLDADTTTKISRAEIFNNLSICYSRLGEKNKYISYLLDALKVAEEQNLYNNRLTILSNLFYYYTDIGNKSIALEYLELAENLALKNNNSYQLANIYAIKATFFWKSENHPNKALIEFNKAISVFNPSRDFFDFANVLKNIADIYVATDSLDKAKEVLIELREISAVNSNSLYYTESLLRLTEIALIENNLIEAEALFNEIQSYPLSDLDFEESLMYSTLKADLTYRKGKRRLAYDELRPVIDQVLDRARTSIDSQTGFWVKADEYINAFNTIVKMAIDLGYNQEALRILDDIKTINDVALYNSPILRANRLSEEDLARDKILNEEILRLRTRFLNTSNAQEKLALNANIDRLSAQRESILNKIRSDRSDSDLSIWSIRNTLSSESMILHITEVGETLYVSTVTNNEINVLAKSFGTVEKALFENAANNVANSSSDLHQLHEVYRTLDLNSLLHPDFQELTVIPDNYLYRIPLDILPIVKPAKATSYGSATYLLEQFNIQYFTSLKEFSDNSRTSYSGLEQEFSAFAISDFSDFNEFNLPALPFATQEVRDINEALTVFSNKGIFLENEATKDSFIREASQSKIVHVATHSEVSEQDPLFSTIYLNSSNSTNNDRALYAYELFDARMNSDLVMLNSCSSGSGNYLQGSGIMGMSRALRYAGAKSLALNLWAVNDKVASEFATAFYRALNDGSTKAQSIRFAKLELLKSGNANPHYWGAYMLIGNPSPVTKKPAKAGLVYPVLILLILGIFFKMRRL